jgi:hypothetical protein
MGILEVRNGNLRGGGRSNLALKMGVFHVPLTECKRMVQTNQWCYYVMYLSNGLS